MRWFGTIHTCQLNVKALPSLAPMLCVGVRILEAPASLYDLRCTRKLRVALALTL
jgi:hypothetical protein